MSTYPHTCLRPNFGSLLKIVDGCHFGQPHHKIGKKKTGLFFTGKMQPVEKTACNLHKRRDFLGKNYPQIRHISREKNRVQIAIFRLQVLATSQILRSPLVEGQQVHLSHEIDPKKKRKPQLVQGLGRAKNSFQNLIGRAQRILCKYEIW